MKRNIVIAVVTAAALIGGGTATAIAISGDDETPTTTHPVETLGSDDDRDDRRDDDGDDLDDRDDRDDLDDDDALARSAKVNAADAVAAALEHRPGTAVSVEMDEDGDDDRDHRSTAAWEVDILGKGATWYSVWIDPNTGKVLGSEVDDDDAADADEVRTALKGTSVTAEQAAKAAAAKGTVTSVDLDDDRDDRGWEVETVTSGDDDREWLVDLNSGKVTADDDDRDDRDDR
ncbi:PepSY domain-containing protein [Streptomyces sp. NPDC046924]|uniref:PepSY domain-containing protein n=1 Tax=Streptomyces sp. NPDC046924 TaxID=3155136 RepID=UPI0033FFCE94